jgi:hypothetical protein
MVIKVFYWKGYTIYCCAVKKGRGPKVRQKYSPVRHSMAKYMKSSCVTPTRNVFPNMYILSYLNEDTPKFRYRLASIFAHRKYASLPRNVLYKNGVR